MSAGLLLVATWLCAAASAWAGPGPLRRARWPASAPRAALVVWLSLWLSVFIATLGVILTIGIRPWRMALVPGLRRALSCLVGCRWGAFSPLQLGLVLLAVGLGTHVLILVVNEFRHAALDRRRHRRILRLVAQPIPLGGGTLVLDHPSPIAYGVPGIRPTVVLSTGALSALEEPQLRAVLAHERAHLRARHDLAVLPFAALASALPHLPLARDGLASTRALVEMLADDAAVRHESATALAAAIIRVARGVPPAEALSDGAGNVTRRVQRLRAKGQAARTWITPLAYGAAVIVLCVPCVLLLAASAQIG